MKEEFKDNNRVIIQSDEINEYISIICESYKSSKKEVHIIIFIKNVPIIVKTFKRFNNMKNFKEATSMFYQNLRKNLKLWSKNNYNTHFIDYKIAFPLLKELSKVGETRFQIIFQQEILKEYASNNEKIKEFLRHEGYLKLIGEFF